MAPRERLGRALRVIAAQQMGLRMDARPRRLAADRRGSNLDVRVVAQSHGLPRLVVGPEEGAIAVEGDAHRVGYGCAVALVRGQEDCLRLSQDVELVVPHAL